MDVSQLKTMVRFYTEAPSTVTLDDTALGLVIQRAYEQVVNELDKLNYFPYVLSQTLAVLNGTKEYYLQGLMRKIVKIYNTDERDELLVVDKRIFPENSTERKVYFNRVTNKIIFFDNPGFARDYTVFYVPIVEILSSEAPFQVPSELHNLIAIKAAMLILMKETAVNVDKFIAEYRYELDTWKDQTADEVSTPTFVRQVESSRYS